MRWVEAETVIPKAETVIPKAEIQILVKLNARIAMYVNLFAMMERIRQMNAWRA